MKKAAPGREPPDSAIRHIEPDERAYTRLKA